jgi:hypothetical protein
MAASILDGSFSAFLRGSPVQFFLRRFSVTLPFRNSPENFLLLPFYRCVPQQLLARKIGFNCRECYYRSDWKEQLLRGSARRTSFDSKFTTQQKKGENHARLHEVFVTIHFAESMRELLSTVAKRVSSLEHEESKANCCYERDVES